MSKSTNCIITNLMICGNLDLVSLCVPQIIRILLAFSDFPTFSEIVLFPKFPLTVLYWHYLPCIVLDCMAWLHWTVQHCIYLWFWEWMSSCNLMLVELSWCSKVEDGCQDWWQASQALNWPALQWGKLDFLEVNMYCRSQGRNQKHFSLREALG